MVTIRPARIEERAKLEALQRAASIAHPDYREQLLANPDAIELDAENIVDGNVHVAVTGNAAVGFLVLFTEKDGACELDGLFVDPARWREGLGRLLIDKARQIALSRGASSISVVANPTALDFYRSCGFVETGAAETRFGPAPTMLLAL